MELMGPQHGIEVQCWRAILGRTCSSGRSLLPERCIRFEVDIIFALQDDICSTEWKLRLQHEQGLIDIRLANDLYSDDS